MLYFIHFILGVISSFLGSLAPSMLNMTAAKISVQQDKKSATNFALGVSIVVFVQAYLATIFTQYLRANPLFVESLQKIALVIFMFLSVFFFKQYKKDNVKIKTKKDIPKNNFVVGLLLSALNMFSIPFYCGVTTAFDSAGWFRFTPSYIIVFVLGSTIGTFLLLFMYLNYANLIQSKAKGLSKNLNLILSILTGILAIVTIVKLM